MNTNRDGLVWYTLRIINTQGIADSVDLSKSTPIIKVLIDTKPKPKKDRSES